MKISVLISAYKAEKYLAEAIASVIRQTRRRKLEIDLIVVSDGCVESWEIAKKYNASGTNILLKENSGVYRAFNTALELVEDDTDYITFNGADDVWHPDRLSEVVSQSRGRVGLTAFSSYYKTINEDGKVTGSVGKHCPTGHFTYCKKVFDVLGGFKDWRCGADTEFFLRARELGTVLFVSPRHLFYYRRHSEQLTQHPKTGKFSVARKDAQEYVRRMRKQPEGWMFGHAPRVTGAISEWSGLISETRIDKIKHLSS